MRLACIFLGVIGLAAGCGSGTAKDGSAGSDGGGQIRLAAVELRKPLTAGNAIRLAQEYDLFATEVKAVYRYGDEQNSLTYLPEPGMTPEEVERAFREESAFDEIAGERDSSFSPQQRRALEEAQKAVDQNAPAVEQIMVCGPRDALFELDSDPRVKAMSVAPKQASANCPQRSLDSDF